MPNKKDKEVKKQKEISKNQRFLWRVYLVIFVLIAVKGYYTFFPELKAIDWFDILVSIPSLIGLYALAFSKTIGHKRFWQNYFYIFLAWYFVYNYYIHPWEYSLFNVLQSIAAIVVIGPIFVALYVYGFKVLRK